MKSETKQDLASIAFAGTLGLVLLALAEAADAWPTFGVILLGATIVLVVVLLAVVDT